MAPLSLGRTLEKCRNQVDTLSSALCPSYYVNVGSIRKHGNKGKIFKGLESLKF